jgi:hypothetical protein
MWSVGALLELEDRAKMEEFLLSHESKLDLPKFKEGETIFEYMVNESGKLISSWIAGVQVGGRKKKYSICFVTCDGITSGCDSQFVIYTHPFQTHMSTNNMEA